MTKQTKKTIGIILVFCLTLSLFSGMSLCVSAAEITSVTLSGNITPVVGGNMNFATAPKSSKYDVVQIWLNGDTNTGFSNSTEYNNTLGSHLTPTSERKFTEGITYGFCVMLIPQKTNVKFASNMTVSIPTYGNMDFLGDMGSGTVMYQIAFEIEGSTVHVRNNTRKYNDAYHWYECKDDTYIFNGSEDVHSFINSTGKCTKCGFTLTESERTVITSQPTSPVTINCGDTLTLTVDAAGRNNKYYWECVRSNSRYSFSNSDNLWQTGSKVSGCYTETLKIEKCNKNIEEYIPIVCRVEGALGKATTEKINVNIIHKSNLCTPIDGNGHKIQCTCGKVIQDSEEHTYNSENKCTVCGYEKGSTYTRFKGATLTMPNFSTDNTPLGASLNATLKGTGIKTSTNGISSIAFYKVLTKVDDKTLFENDTDYKVRIYPDFDENFYMDNEEKVQINYNGIDYSVTPKFNSSDRTYYFEISNIKPFIKNKVEFSANGGEGSQTPLYVDEHNQIYFPKCTFTKTDDEFYAWEYNGKLYAEDTEETSPVSISEAIATVKAVWRSQLTDNVIINTDYPQNGGKVSDVRFYVPQFADYYISNTTWYEDGYQDITGDELGKILTDTTTLDKNKDYNVRVVVYGKGFASADKLKVTVNNRTIDNVTKSGLQGMTFVLHIKGGTEIDVWNPIDNMQLTAPSDITVTDETKFSVNQANTYWSSDEEGSSKLPESTVATLGTQYYLNCRLSYTSSAANTIIFGNTITIKGVDYPVESFGADYINLVIPFTAQKLNVRLTEDKNGVTYIDSPKAMNVAAVATLRTADGLVKGILVNPSISLTAGVNTVTLITISSEGLAPFIYRDREETVEIMVFDNLQLLRPLCGVHNYKHIEKK